MTTRDNGGMNQARSLQDWLAYIERQHPQDIALGLDRVRAVAERMGLVAPAERAILESLGA